MSKATAFLKAYPALNGIYHRANSAAEAVQNAIEIDWNDWIREFDDRFTISGPLYPVRALKRAMNNDVIRALDREPFESLIEAIELVESVGLLYYIDELEEASELLEAGASDVSTFIEELAGYSLEMWNPLLEKLLERAPDIF